MNDKTNSIDYKKIPLTLAGVISSANIYRNNLTQLIKQPTVSFMDNMEDDDEQFILNLKNTIDKNCKMQNKGSYSMKNLQNKSFSLKRKKSLFSDEDENLMKRFKKSLDESKAENITPQKLQRSENVNCNNDDNISMLMTTPLFTRENLMKRFNKSVDENKTLNITPQKLQRSENVNYNNDDNIPIPMTTSLFTPAVALNNVDKSLRNKANKFFFQVTSKKNDQMITPANTKTVTEVEQLIYYEMHYLTPPRTIDM